MKENPEKDKSTEHNKPKQQKLHQLCLTSYDTRSTKPRWANSTNFFLSTTGTSKTNI